MNPEPSNATELQWTPELVGRFWDYYADNAPEDYFTHLYGDQIVARTSPFLRHGDTIADLGCGAGFLIDWLVPRFRVVGFDHSPRNLERTRARLHGRPGFLGASPADAMPSDGRFDALYLVETIEHVPENGLSAILSAAGNALKPGGTIIVTTPNAERLEDSMVYCPSCRHTFHRWQHVQTFTADRLRETMRASGFEAVEVFTTDFSCRSTLQKSVLALRRLAGRKAPHLVYVGRKTAAAPRPSATTQCAE